MRLDDIHLFLHRIRQTHEISISRCIYINIYGIQAIHPIITQGVLFLHLYLSQIIQVNHLATYFFYWNRSQISLLISRYQPKSHPLLLMVSSGLQHRTYHLVFSDIVTDGILHFLRCYTTSRQQHRIVAYLHISFCRARNFNFCHAIYRLQRSYYHA